MANLRKYITNYILNDVFIEIDSAFSLIRRDSNYIFNAIYDPNTPGLRVTAIIGMSSSDLEDMPDNLIAGKYLQVNATADAYELVDIIFPDHNNLIGLNLGDYLHLTQAQLDNLNNQSGINTGDQDLSGYVPYTGATQDVDLGLFDLSANIINIPTTVDANNGVINQDNIRLLHTYPGTGLGHNTFVGKNGGNFTLTTGYDNTTIGELAGYRLTTGYGNFFGGYKAGYLTTTGNRNMYLGGYSGIYGTTAEQNMGIGYATLYKNQTGVLNVAIGPFAGYETLGSYNTLIGGGANYWSNGAYNTVIGYRAGMKGINTNNNLLIGHYAGYNNATNHNLAIGYLAQGLGVTTGQYNTGLGSYTNYKLTSGTRNVSIGHSAGYSNLTGTDNLFLGYHSGYNELGSNKLYISNSDTSTPLIKGDFATKDLEINDNLKVNGKLTTKINTYTTSHTAGDERTMLFYLATTDYAVTLPDASTCPGLEYRIKVIYNGVTENSYVLSIITNGGNIDNSTSFTIDTLYDAVTVQSDGANWWVL